MASSLPCEALCKQEVSVSSRESLVPILRLFILSNRQQIILSLGQRDSDSLSVVVGVQKSCVATDTNYPGMFTKERVKGGQGRESEERRGKERGEQI